MIFAFLDLHPPRIVECAPEISARLNLPESPVPQQAAVPSGALADDATERSSASFSERLRAAGFEPPRYEDSAAYALLGPTLSAQIEAAEPFSGAKNLAAGSLRESFARAAMVAQGKGGVPCAGPLCEEVQVSTGEAA